MNTRSTWLLCMISVSSVGCGVSDPTPSCKHNQDPSIHCKCDNSADYSDTTISQCCNHTHSEPDPLRPGNYIVVSDGTGPCKKPDQNKACAYTLNRSNLQVRIMDMGWLNPSGVPAALECLGTSLKAHWLWVNDSSDKLSAAGDYNITVKAVGFFSPPGGTEVAWPATKDAAWTTSVDPCGYVVMNVDGLGNGFVAEGDYSFGLQGLWQYPAASLGNVVETGGVQESAAWCSGNTNSNSTSNGTSGQASGYVIQNCNCDGYAVDGATFSSSVCSSGIGVYHACSGTCDTGLPSWGSVCQ